MATVQDKNTYQARANAAAKSYGIQIPSTFADDAYRIASLANYDGNQFYWGRTQTDFWKIANGKPAPKKSEYSKPYDWVVENLSPEKAVELYKDNKKDFYNKVLKGAAYDYSGAYFENQRFKTGYTQQVFDKTKSQLQNYVNQASQAGLSSADLFNPINDGSNKWSSVFQKDLDNSKDSGFWAGFDKVFAFAFPVVNAMVTSGLSLGTQLAYNAASSIAQGADPKEILKNTVATIVADGLTKGIPGVEASKNIPTELSKINKAIADAGPGFVSATVQSGLINAERQAVAALITGQDIAKNAAAGFAGGTLADLVGVGLAKLSPTMSDSLIQSLSRAVAEYGQYKTAGFTDEEALAKATTGYLAEQQKIEAAAARQKQQTAGLTTEQVGLSQTYGQTAGLPYGQAGQYTGVETDGKSLAPVEVTGTGTVYQPAGADLSLTPGARRTSATESRSLAPVTVYGRYEPDIAEDLSISSTSSTAKTADEPAPAEKTPEKLRQDMILTSLINRNVTSPLYSSKAKTVAKEAGTPGTAALAQALRVGDVGAPIFGRDEEGRRAGWNLQSLRYMGDVGAEK
jgi:hypothetical protein